MVNSLVEVSAGCVVQILASKSVSSLLSVASPGGIMVGALIVMSALRSDPKLPGIMGLVAGAELVVLGTLLPATPPSLASMLLLVLCAAGAGLGGKVLAKHQVELAETALRRMREQDLFGKYLLHEQLGRGGMGEVFRATYCPEGGFVRTVAIKRVRRELSSDPRFAEAFRREVQLGASLAHPNLVQLLDCGRFRGEFIVAMELVDGTSLAALLEPPHGPLPLAAITYVGAELASALEYLHTRRGADGMPLGLVHCDVNPPNILLSRNGEVKLADFGVVRAGAVGTFAGKEDYAPPEQLSGAPLDGRVDLYALGITLEQALRRTPRSSIPPELERLLAQMRAPAPADRPSDAVAVRAALLAISGDAAAYPYGERLLAAAVRAEPDQHRSSTSTTPSVEGKPE